MQTVSRVTRPRAVGCWELRSMGLVGISRCCETCHSAERYSWGGSLGPCRARLPDGRQGLGLLREQEATAGGRAHDGAARATIRAPREAKEERKP
jgi:hypothetical protein